MRYIKITSQSPDYPAGLFSLHDAPDSIFIRGNSKALFKTKKVGIVGSRNMTPYGKRVLQSLVPPLVRNDIAIISGLAFGIDAEAHRLTLESGGIPIAVLGSGIDTITPRSNESLGQAVEKSGAIVSEYPPHTPTHKSNFPARNRIIAGLSDALIVIEGGAHSGSLITADFMLQLGKDVFAVPGPIDAPMSIGPNFLLANGAHVARSADDILLLYGIDANHPRESTGVDRSQATLVSSDVSREEATVLSNIRAEGASVDDICELCTLPASTVNTALTTLELKGYVKRIAPGIFIRMYNT